MKRHHGGSDSCERIQKMLEAFARYGEYSATTLQLQRFTGDMAVAATIADLRKIGYNLPPAEYLGRTNEGRKVYLYRLKGRGKWLKK